MKNYKLNKILVPESSPSGAEPSITQVNSYHGIYDAKLIGLLVLNAQKIKNLLRQQHIDHDLQGISFGGFKNVELSNAYIEKVRIGWGILRAKKKNISLFSNIRNFVSKVILGSKIPLLLLTYTLNLANFYN